MIEAIFLVRAYRTTLPRFGYTNPVDTGAMQLERRVSATYKDLPGGDDKLSCAGTIDAYVRGTIGA